MYEAQTQWPLDAATPSTPCPIRQMTPQRRSRAKMHIASTSARANPHPPSLRASR